MSKARKFRTVAAIFGSAIALAIGGCGSSDEDIPRRSANELLGQIDSIRSAVDDDRCEDASEGASSFAAGVESLNPDEVPEDVITALEAGAERLGSLVDSECGAEQTTTDTTTETTAPTTEPTTTVPTTTTTTTTTTTDPETDDDGSDGDEDTGGTGAGGTEAPQSGGGGGATPRDPGVDGAGGRG